AALLERARQFVDRDAVVGRKMKGANQHCPPIQRVMPAAPRAVDPILPISAPHSHYPRPKRGRGAHPDPRHNSASNSKGMWLAVNFREVVHSVRTGNADVAKPHRFAEDRMDTHKNARLTPKGREEMVRAVVDRGMSNAAAARQFNTTPKT